MNIKNQHMHGSQGSSVFEPMSSSDNSRMAFVNHRRCDGDDRPCFYMIYVSRIRILAALQPNTFKEILQASLLNNRKERVDGLLLFADGLFFQYLEGSEEALTNIKNRLLMDKRHGQLKLLSFKRTNEHRLYQSSLWFVWLDKTELKQLMQSLSFDFNPYDWNEEKQMAMIHALIASKPMYTDQLPQSLIRTRLRFLAIGNFASSVKHRPYYLLFLIIAIFLWIVFLLCR